MKSKKADRWIVLSLLAALAIETVLLLWHLGVINPLRHNASVRQGPAGLVAKYENELRRRSVDSLVWEHSHADEAVFYYDSLLTLTQSTATIALAQDTEVELNENTLVTIEPPEQSSAGEIRLKFVRGNLQARNPWTNTRISAPDFVVDLKAGSEMQLRQTGTDEFEVQVKQGEAQVSNASGGHHLLPTQLLRFTDGKAEALNLDSSLAWIDPPPARIYSHSDSLQQRLHWSGRADELSVQTSGKSERRIALAPEQQQLELSFESGDHLIYLRGQGRSSAALRLQLWRAPLLHLIAPLPRNRVHNHELTSFIWTRASEVAGYVFKIRGQEPQKDTELKVNSHQHRFDKEDDVHWSVWGRDRDGFLIPPLYEYPLFIRDEPFAPPTLNAPRVRKPANDRGAFFWLQQLLLPVAYADEDARYEAGFSWQPVSGADQYLIEISETPDFRKPVVSARTSKTEYIWRDFRDRTYFWRVAAGSRSGRMGVFSEPAQVSLTEGVEIRKIEVVKAKPVEPAADAPVAVNPPADTPAPAEAVAAEPEPIHDPSGLRIMWRAGYGVWTFNGEQRVKATLGGIKAVAFAAERDIFTGEKAWWTAEGFYSRSSFKPEPAEEYPLQEEITVQEITARLSRVSATSPWGYGFSAALRPGVERSGPESVHAKSLFTAGLHGRTLKKFSRSEYRGDFGILGGAGGYGVSTSHRLLMNYRRLLLGIGIEGVYIKGGYSDSLSADAFVTLGFEF